MTSARDTEKNKPPRRRISDLPDVSVDYAVMEKYLDVAVVRANFDWNDVGSWNAIGELTAPNSNGNGVMGEAITLTHGTATYKAIRA
jgi:mannose-1-phosphate guanylyltransferase